MDIVKGLDIDKVSKDDLSNLSSKYKDTYQTSDPFPHIYFDDFLDAGMLEKVLGEFPDLEKESDVKYNNPNESKKIGSNGEYSLGYNGRKLIRFLNSQMFLDFLQDLTGIKERLIPDPDLIGGGYHEIKPEGFLKLHVDFHKHPKTKLDRRLNLLVYLNQDWEEEYGGHFELWERDMSECKVKIAPLFNRVALFNTTGDSWHGHPNPLTCPKDRSRKSLALYYYSNGRPENEIKKSDQKRITTTFAARKGIDSPKMKYFNKAVNFANWVLPSSVVSAIKKLKD